MSKVFATFHRNGLELHVCKLNGFRFESLGSFTGYVRGVECFESVMVVNAAGQQFTVTAADTDGPATIKISGEGIRTQYVGLAGAATVQAISKNAEAAV